MKNVKYWLLAGALIMIATWVAMAGNRKGWFKPQKETTEQPDAREEFRKLSERFLQPDAVIDITGSIKLYDGENKDQLKEQSDFHIIKEPASFYSRLSYVQMLSDDRLSVQVDSVNRIIIAAKTAGVEKNDATAVQKSLNGLFDDTTAFRAGGITGNAIERTLSFSSDLHPEIRRYHITYDPATYQLKNAAIEWWKDGVVLDTTAAERVWISKMEYHYSPATGGKVKEMMDDILAVRNGKIQLTEKYKDYQLHIATSQQP